MSLAIATSLAVAASGVSAAESAPRATEFHIPAGPMAQALNRFAQQSDLTLLYDASLTRYLQAPAVDGAYEPKQALDRLLAGSSLVARVGADGSVRIEHDSAPAAAPAAPKPAAARTKTTTHGRVENLDAVDVHATSSGYAAQQINFGKLPTDPREIPSSVSVVTRQRMDDQNMITVAEALNRSTGITAVPYGMGTSYFQARGYQPDVQFDGIPANNGLQYQSQFDLNMYDAIEIFRGPAGILQGQGSPGGTVNLLRKRPGDTYSLLGAISVGSWNNFQGNVDISDKLNASGTIRGRAVVSAQDTDYFYDKAHSEHQLVYGIIDFDLTPDTTLTLSGAWQREDHSPLDWGQSVLAVPPHGKVLDAPRSQFYGTDWSADQPHMSDLYAELRHAFSDTWQAKVAVDRRSSIDHSTYGYINGLISPFGNRAGYWLQRQQTQLDWTGVDASVSGQFDLFGRTHETTFGIDYAQKRNDGYNGGFLANGGVPVDVLNLPNIPAPDIPFDSHDKTLTKQYGVYGEVRLHPTDQFSVLVGSHFTWYRNRTQSGYPYLAGWKNDPDVNHKAAPYFGLVYDINKNLSAYASYTNIFVPQNNLRYGGGTLKPRTGKQYEVGLKGAFLDGMFTGSLAAFRIRDENRAIDDLAHPNYFVSAGHAQSQGWEAEINGRPLPGWDIYAGYTYLMTHVKDDPNGVTSILDTEEPKKTFKLWTTYRFTGNALDGFRIGGGARAVSSTSRGTVTQKGYTVFDAQVGYQFNPSWLLTLTVNNVFDKTYFARVPASYFGIYGDPRNTMLTLRKTL